MTIDKSKDAVVHIFHFTGNRPIEALLQRVERPQTSVVTLGGDDEIGFEEGGYLTGQIVGTSDMSRENGDDMLPHTVDTYNRRIFVLVFDIGSYGANTNTHRSDEDKRIILLPQVTYVAAFDDGGIELTLKVVGNILSFLKGVGVHLEEQLIISILDIINQKVVTYKDVKLTSFDIRFKTNISLPSYIGIGKNASIGNGLLMRE